ncbi:hypothetical protein LSM04_007442 [Trypanosoma melophagium]|nr:hypothetical protein LSM04_007442 [Trypanosoma melophagium]
METRANPKGGGGDTMDRILTPGTGEDNKTGPSVEPVATINSQETPPAPAEERNSFYQSANSFPDDVISHSNSTPGTELNNSTDLKLSNHDDRPSTRRRKARDRSNIDSGIVGEIRSHVKGDPDDTVSISIQIPFLVLVLGISIMLFP